MYSEKYLGREVFPVPDNPSRIRKREQASPRQKGADRIDGIEHIVRLEIAVKAVHQLAERHLSVLLGRLVRPIGIHFVDGQQVGEVYGGLAGFLYGRSGRLIGHALRRIAARGVRISRLRGGFFAGRGGGHFAAVFDRADGDPHDIVDDIGERRDADDDRKAHEEIARVDLEKVGVGGKYVH